MCLKKLCNVLVQFFVVAVNLFLSGGGLKITCISNHSTWSSKQWYGHLKDCNEHTENDHYIIMQQQGKYYNMSEKISLDNHVFAMIL